MTLSADSKRAQQPPSKEELIEGSPTLKGILGGRAKIEFVSKFLQTKKIGGKEWSGNNYGYKLTLPPQTEGGKERIIDISSWSPLPLNYGPYEDIPKRQVTILTGHGEMPLTGNAEVEDLVLKEISRQVNPPAADKNPEG